MTTGIVELIAYIVVCLCFVGLGYIMGRLANPRKAVELGIKAAEEHWNKMLAQQERPDAK